MLMFVKKKKKCKYNTSNIIKINYNKVSDQIEAKLEFEFFFFFFLRGKLNIYIKKLNPKNNLSMYISLLLIHKICL